MVSESSCVDFHPDKRSCTIKLTVAEGGGTSTNKFTFDRVFDVNCT